MNKFLTGLIVFLVVAAIGFTFYERSKAPATVPAPVVTPYGQMAGAAASPEHYNQEYFYNGLSASKFYGLNSVSASSSSTTAASITLALGAGASGQITIGTSTPGTTVVNASTTAVTFNSMVFLQQTSTTTIAGVTCNSTPTTTPIVKVSASSTLSSLNGFTATSAAVPVTNPLCYNYVIVDKSR